MAYLQYVGQMTLVGKLEHENEANEIRVPVNADAYGAPPGGTKGHSCGGLKRGPLRGLLRGTLISFVHLAVYQDYPETGI